MVLVLLTSPGILRLKKGNNYSELGQILDYNCIGQYFHGENKMKKLIIAVLLTQISSVTFANTIVTETSTWKSVPITVDTNKHTYVYEGPVPEGNYYYSYSGYRCFKEKRTIVGIDALIFHAGVSGGSDIYCYPE